AEYLIRPKWPPRASPHVHPVQRAYAFTLHTQLALQTHNNTDTPPSPRYPVSRLIVTRDPRGLESERQQAFGRRYDADLMILRRSCRNFPGAWRKAFVYIGKLWRVRE